MFNVINYMWLFKRAIIHINNNTNEHIKHNT